MDKAPLDSSRLLNIAGSKSHTLNTIALALKADKSLIVKNPYPKLNLDRYKNLLRSRGFDIDCDERDLKLNKIDNIPNDALGNIPGIPAFEIDDMPALFCAISFKSPLRFLVEDNEDFERKFLILRRLGIVFGDIKFIDGKNTIDIKDFKPIKIKFSFQESNFYLANYVGKLCALFDIEAEFLSKIDVISPLAENIFPLRLEAENLQKSSNDDDELHKRLQRLRKNQKEEKRHFRIRPSKDEISEHVQIPADPFVAALATVISIVDTSEVLKIGPLMEFEGERTFAKILAKFGVKCDFHKQASDDGSTLFYYQIKPEKLTGRKIDESLMRSFPICFGPLAILASFADAKTILRGLPSSSSLWQTRIAGVADILSTAGIRIGEVEDGFVIEPPQEFRDIEYINFDDPYLQLIQLAAGILINEKPLTTDFFLPIAHYPHFQSLLDKIRPRSKSLAS